MTIEQLKSGSYRITQMYEGVRYRVTVNHKPSQKEAIELIDAEMRNGHAVIKGTFLYAANEYIDMRSNVLSPRTIREYKLQPARLPKWFQNKQVSALTQKDVQRCVNEMSQTMKPKTIRTLHGFIAAVMGVARPNLILHTSLPQLQKIEPYIPKKEDIAAILKEAEDTPYHIPIQLALYGLRRGEICALEVSDIDENNVVHITKDLVQAPNGEWVKKPPKTPTSVRAVPIKDSLAEEIRQQGYVYNGYPGAITTFLDRAQTKLGLEKFSVHKLRHLFASTLLDTGCDLKTIQDLGGWRSNETVTKVYLHSLKLKEEELRKKAVAGIDNMI